MATISEDYVSFETAKLLREKGFTEKCRTYYKVFPKDRIAAIYHSSENRGISEDDPNEILCPTLQMAMKWLREVHNLQIQIAPITSRHKDWSFGIYKEFSPLTIDLLCFPTYEQAAEAAIKHCIEYLI